jgi:anti-sigma factor RsiW
LLRYHEGELQRPERKRVESHISQCDLCRSEWEKLGCAIEPAQSAETDASMLEGVLAGIRQVETRAAEDGAARASLRARVAAKIEPYLGPKATSDLLQSVSPDGQNLLSNLEPVLALFLGRRAANQLVNQIIDEAIVRC